MEKHNFVLKGGTCNGLPAAISYVSGVYCSRLIWILVFGLAAGICSSLIISSNAGMDFKKYFYHLRHLLVSLTPSSCMYILYPDSQIDMIGALITHVIYLTRKAIVVSKLCGIAWSNELGIFT